MNPIWHSKKNELSNIHESHVHYFAWKINRGQIGYSNYRKLKWGWEELSSAIRSQDMDGREGVQGGFRDSHVALFGLWKSKLGAFLYAWPS